MRAALVLLIVAVGLLAALRSRLAALNLYAWFALFRPQEWTYGAVESFRLSTVCAIALILPCIVSGVLPNVTNPLMFGSLAFLGTAVWARLNGTELPVSPIVDGPPVRDALIDLALLIVIAALATNILTSRKRITWYIAMIAVSLALHGAETGLLGLLRGGGTFSGGIGGPFNDNNAFALGVVRVLFLIPCAAATLEWTGAKFALLPLIPFSVVAVVFSNSRGAFLALVAGAVAYALMHRRRVLALAVVVLLAVPTAFLLPDNYASRLNTISDYEDDGSALGRLHFWRVAVEMARDQPFGVGIGNFPTNYDRYDFSHGKYGSRRAVHSSHFQALAETGYLGFAIFEGLFVCAFWRLWRLRRLVWSRPDLSDAQRSFYLTVTTGLLASLVAFLVGGSFLSEVLNDLNWFLFAAVAAVDRVAKAELSPAPAPELAPVDDVRWPQPAAAPIATLIGRERSA